MTSYPKKCAVCGRDLQSSGTDDPTVLPWQHADTGDAFAGLGSQRHEAQPLDEVARAQQLHHYELAHHIGATAARLDNALDQAVYGPPSPGPVQTRLVPDPMVTNQHWRNSRGSLRGLGVGATADVPRHELVSEKWYTQQRPVPPIDEDPPEYK
jgi:hypothetical protein